MTFGAAAVLGPSHKGVHGLGGHHAGGHALGDGNVDVLAFTTVLNTEQANGGCRGAVEAAAMEAAERFRNISPQVLAAQKDIIAKWLEMGEEEGAEDSIKAFALGFTSSHPKEAMSAFLEKREPRFKS